MRPAGFNAAHTVNDAPSESERTNRSISLCGANLPMIFLLSGDISVTHDNKKISLDNKKISHEDRNKFSRKFVHVVVRYFFGAPQYINNVWRGSSPTRRSEPNKRGAETICGMQREDSGQTAPKTHFS